MATVNAHFINPFILSEDWMEFDLILSGGLTRRGAKTTPRPVSRPFLVAYAASLVAEMSTEEAPLELGEVVLDVPEGIEVLD